MAPVGSTFVRIASAAAGLFLILMSSILYEKEEGTIQNKLEEWWVVLSDTESRAVNKHAAFMSGVANLGGRLFDRLFGEKLFSLRSVAVSACFSLASLGLVCTPGLSGWLIEIPSFLYITVIALLLVMGVLPSVLGPGWPKKLWLLGVVVLTFICFVGMDVVNWFDVPSWFETEGDSTAEVFYYLIFVVVTVASDSLFIAATRWLLRISSKFNSRTKILGLMVGNVSLACLLVIVPVSLAWGVRSVGKIVRSHDIVSAVNYYVAADNPNQSFLASVAASNVLDGLVACTFFILLSVLLIHRLVWPTIQRPVYALAS